MLLDNVLQLKGSSANQPDYRCNLDRFTMQERSLDKTVLFVNLQVWLSGGTLIARRTRLSEENTYLWSVGENIGKDILQILSFSINFNQVFSAIYRYLKKKRERNKTSISVSGLACLKGFSVREYHRQLGVRVQFNLQGIVNAYVCTHGCWDR